MPRIRCHYSDCVFIDDGYCGAAAVELDPDLGCQTYSRADDSETSEDWSEEEDEVLEEWEDLEGEDEEEDELWLDEDEY
jgi:hypothetical protein